VGHGVSACWAESGTNLFAIGPEPLLPSFVNEDTSHAAANAQSVEAWQRDLYHVRREEPRLICALPKVVG